MTDEITLFFLVFSEKLANECGYYAFLVRVFNQKVALEVALIYARFAYVLFVGFVCQQTVLLGCFVAKFIEGFSYAPF